MTYFWSILAIQTASQNVGFGPSARSRKTNKSWNGPRNENWKNMAKNIENRGESYFYNILSYFHSGFWESVEGSFGPFGPKVGKRVRKWVPGASQPQGPKSRKRSRKRVKSIVFQLFCFFIDSVFDFLGPGAERPRELLFGLSFQLWGRRAQMTSVAGKSFRNLDLFSCFGPRPIF